MEFPQFVSPSYTTFSRKGSCAQTINLSLERAEIENGRNTYSFYKMPGLKGILQPSGTTGRFRGAIELNEHLFVVVDNMIYDIVQDFVINATYGPIDNDGLPVFMSIDNVTCLIVSQNKLYAINSGTLTTPATPVPPIGVALRGYWVIIGPPTPDQVFYFSADGLTWDPLDFQSTESAPNNIVALISDHLLLWFVGNRVTQPFSLGSDPDTPFVARQDAVMQEGTAAASSVVAADGSLFWIKKDKNGERMVTRVNGFQATRCSKHNIETALAGYTRVDDAIGQAFQLNGHTHIRFTFPDADRTWDYDVSVDDWTEALAWDTGSGQYERHRANVIVSAFSKVLAGDHTNGWLMEMSYSFFSDDWEDVMGTGALLRWLRRAPHLVKDGKGVCYHRMEVDCERGVGDGSSGTPESDPQMSIRWSDDGGDTYSNEMLRSMGRLGESRVPVAINSPGTAVDRVWEISGSAGTKVAIFNMWFEATVLRH